MKGPTINGKPHSLIVMRVLERDEQGRPSKCIVGYDDTSFRLDDPGLPNEFMTAFVPTEMINKRTIN